ncbi:hypothetical protein TorRG33x02_352700, partial [Trema orientale]
KTDTEEEEEEEEEEDWLTVNQRWVSLVLALPWVSIGHWNPQLHHLLFFDVPWTPIAMDLVRRP